jgi:hypothetical protein
MALAYRHTQDDVIVLYLVAIAWMYVVLMMSAAEALAPNGSLLGAVITFVLYGVLPLALVLYLLGTPARRRALRAAEASAAQPDGSRHAAGDAVAPKREEP